MPKSGLKNQPARTGSVPHNHFHEFRINRRKGKVEILDTSNVFVPLPTKYTKLYEHIENSEGRAWFNMESQLHRIGKPAVEGEHSSVEWWENGKLHRLGGAAVKYVNGYEAWYHSGIKHREDGPAVTYGDGTKEWYIEGKLHRKNGPAVESCNGLKMWYKEGLLHRAGAPAVEEVDGGVEWWFNGSPHRFDGLAVDLVGGLQLWCVHGVTSGASASVCEKAVSHGLTDVEFYELCTHEDYVVRQLAAHNPKCPVEGKVLVELLNN